MPSALLMFLIFALSVCGCSADSGELSSSAEDVTSTNAAALGMACASDGECRSGLCLLSEYAPVGFCSSLCDVDGAPCPADDGAPPSGYCVRMPDEFIGPEPQFCVPLCKTKQECTALSPTWETCREPEYKGNPLYPSEVGIFVCQSPSALGSEPVDPVSCSGWRAAYGQFVTQQNICSAYCDYLSRCAEPPKNADCCAYGCMLSMVVQGEFDVLYEKEKKCMVTAYDGFRNTTQWCTAPPSQCNSSWEDTSP